MDEDAVDGVGISAPPRNTVKAQLPDQCTIRKSANGRALLYIDDSPYTDARCSSSITQFKEVASTFHRHEQNGRQGTDFTKPTTIHCFHCCAPFDGPPVPLVRDYCAATQTYTVFGNFCSLSCSLGYASENSNFNSGLIHVLQEKMAREVYGVTCGIRAAPPRLSLEQFGGPYSLERFRQMEKRGIQHEPPFVSAYHVIEERDHQHDCSTLDANMTGSVRGLRRPAAHPEEAPSAPMKSMYEDFLKEQHDDLPDEIPKPIAANTTKAAGATRSKKEKAPPNASKLDGPLSAFIK